MGFDSIIDDFEKSDEGKKNTTPAIVTETINKAVEFINIDYLPKIQDIRLIKKYLTDYKSMNLYDRGWRIQFGTSKQWAGLCSAAPTQNALSKDKNIFISIEVTKHDANWKKNMCGVILHECAHAIVREIFANNMAELNRIDYVHRTSKGHGIVWKAICNAVNGDPSQCTVNVENARFKESFKAYMYDCPRCGHQGFGDFPNFESLCVKCGKSIDVEANVN